MLTLTDNILLSPFDSSHPEPEKNDWPEKQKLCVRETYTSPLLTLRCYICINIYLRKVEHVGSDFCIDVCSTLNPKSMVTIFKNINLYSGNIVQLCLSDSWVLTLNIQMYYSAL